MVSSKDNLTNPIISVCVQTYQHASYIRDTLDSILMQKTDFAFEIVLGEDESTDGTREICIEYAEKYHGKIRLFLNSRKNVIYINGLPTGRWNFMNNLKNARGKYIALLPGDDYWTDECKLQKQVDFLDAHQQCSICFHAFKKVIENESRPPEFCFPPGRKPIYTLEDFLKNSFIASVTTVFRRNLFEYFPEWYYRMPQGDWPLHVLNAQHGDIGYIDEVMGVYRVHSGGIWASCDTVTLLEKMIQGMEIINPHLETIQQEINMSTGSSLCFQAVKLCEEKGQLRRARHFRRKCLTMCRRSNGLGLDLAKVLCRIYALPLWKAAGKLRRFLG